MFVTLKPFSERRHDPKLYSDYIINQIRADCAKEIPEASMVIFGAPAVNGLGNAGGFKIIMEDTTGNLELKDLQDRTEAVIAAARKDPRIFILTTVFRANCPQLYFDVDRKQCASMGVNPNDVFNTLQIYLGSLYVNDFNLFGRTWQVNVQADAKFRDQFEDVKQLKVRNANGGSMVPLASLLDMKTVNGPLIIGRYNMRTAAAINGSLKPGISSGDGITIMQDVCDQELPKGRMGYEWTEITFLQIRSGNTAAVLFLLAVVLVFLVLAAQYESWALPLAVILVVPMCLLGSVAERGLYRFGHQHLYADRLCRISGSGQQERDPYCRICEGQARGGGVDSRSDTGGLPSALAPHSDDLLRLHPRRCPAHDRHRSRRGNAPRPGNRRLQRHDRRHLLRHLPDARVLPSDRSNIGGGRWSSRPGKYLIRIAI